MGIYPLPSGRTALLPYRRQIRRPLPPPPPPRANLVRRHRRKVVIVPVTVPSPLVVKPPAAPQLASAIRLPSDPHPTMETNPSSSKPRTLTLSLTSSIVVHSGLAWARRAPLNFVSDQAWARGPILCCASPR
jgi:hypothetical protein